MSHWKISDPERVGVRSAMRDLAEKSLLQGHGGVRSAGGDYQRALDKSFYAAPVSRDPVRQKLQRPPRRRRVCPVSVLESIVKDLEALPAPKLVEVAHYVSRLNPKRREERLAALKATAGCLVGEDGEAFEKAVREEGDRIDLDDWK